jgi:hypothetical protein
MRMAKYICKYKDGKRKRQITITASGRAAAMLGIIVYGIEMNNVIDLSKVNKLKASTKK